MAVPGSSGPGSKIYYCDESSCEFIGDFASADNLKDRNNISNDRCELTTVLPNL